MKTQNRLDRACRGPKFKIQALIGLVLCLLLIVFIVPSFAQTSDDYYNKAVNKYFLGDNDGAIKDLNEALRIDPTNTKAKDLMQEIRKETGALTPPPAIIAPVPAPTRTTVPPIQKELEELKKEIKKVTEKEKAPPKEKPEEAPPKPKPAPPQFIFQKVEAPKAGIALTSIDFIWILAAILTILYIILRYMYFFLKQQFELRSIQVCTECKWSNPGSSEFCAKCGSRLKPWVGVTAAQRKWYTKFNWKKNPFTLDIMPKLFTGYQPQVDQVFEKVYEKAGHILVMGNKGTGKTTMLKWLADVLSKEFNTVYIPRPTDHFEDLLEYLAKQLKIKKGKGEKITIYDVEAMVGKTEKNILLLLDEAHEFNQEFERPLRTLGDLNGVNFVLAGLMEAHDKIKRDSPPFYDRIIREVVLQHLSLEETTELIKKRIEDAGGTGIEPFTPPAIENVFKMTSGIPRTILKVCDWVVAEAIHHNLDKIGSPETESLPKETLDEETTKGGKERS